MLNVKPANLSVLRGEAMTANPGLQAPVQFFDRSSDEAPFAGARLVDYEIERAVAQRLAEACLQADGRANLLLFGYPGNGKRAFAKAISRTLWQQLSFSLLWVDISALVGSTGSLARESLDVAEHYLLSRSTRPLSLVFDDLDSLRAAAGESSVAQEIEKLLLASISIQTPPQLFITTICRTPNDVLKDMRGLAGSVLYFDWPSESRITQFLKGLNLPSPDKVAAELFALSSQQRVRYTSGSILGGARLALKTVAGLGQQDASRVAQVISNFCAPTPEDEIASYQAELGTFLSRAQQELSEFP